MLEVDLSISYPQNSNLLNKMIKWRKTVSFDLQFFDLSLTLHQKYHLLFFLQKPNVFFDSLLYSRPLAVYPMKH